MPELPEVETVARTLRPLVVGRRIDAFELRWHRALVALDPDAFTAAIAGRTVADVTRRAKLVVFTLDDGSAVTVHLRMTGELLFRASSTAPRTPEREPYLRALFELSGGAELLFYDTRKFGKVSYVPASEIDVLQRTLGIEPLSDAFTPEALSSLLGSRARQIKPLLLDQRVIAGLGNIYVDEALFLARIHPLHRSRSIPADVAEALHRAIVDILSAAVENRGTTFRDYRTGTGEPGSNQFLLRVYGRKPGTPCPDCETPLQRLVVGQRGTIFCPSCQPLPEDYG